MHKSAVLIPFLVLFPTGGLLLHVSLLTGITVITISKRKLNIHFPRLTWFALSLGFGSAVINLEIKVVYILVISSLILLLKVEIKKKIANFIFYIYSIVYILIRALGDDYHIGILNNHVFSAFLYFYLYLFAEEKYKNFFILIFITFIFGNRTLVLCVAVYTVLIRFGKERKVLINTTAFLIIFLMQFNSDLILKNIEFGSHYHVNLGRIIDFQDGSAASRLQQYKLFFDEVNLLSLITNTSTELGVVTEKIMIPHSSIITSLSTGGILYLLFLHLLAFIYVEPKFYIPILVGSSLLHNSFILPVLLLIQMSYERGVHDQNFRRWRRQEGHIGDVQ